MIINLTANLSNNRNDLQLNWTLMALANMAMKDDNHQFMIKGFIDLMTLVSDGSPSVKLQTLKLLVNLSSNAEMVPYLLATKVNCFFKNNF